MGMEYTFLAAIASLRYAVHLDQRKLGIHHEPVASARRRGHRYTNLQTLSIICMIAGPVRPEWCANHQSSEPLILQCSPRNTVVTSVGMRMALIVGGLDL